MKQILANAVTELDKEQVELLIDIQAALPKDKPEYGFYFSKTKDNKFRIIYDSAEYIRGLTFLIKCYEDTYYKIMTENKEELLLNIEQEYVPASQRSVKLDTLKQTKIFNKLVDILYNSGILITNVNNKQINTKTLYGSEGMLGCIKWFVTKFY